LLLTVPGEIKVCPNDIPFEGCLFDEGHRITRAELIDLRFIVCPGMIHSELAGIFTLARVVTLTALRGATSVTIFGGGSSLLHNTVYTLYILFAHYDNKYIHQ
jgi:hypothetical protein